MDNIVLADLFIDALWDSVKMLPFLLVIYYVVEWFELRFSANLESKLKKTGKIGPIVGSIFGCIPQCGFSVVASALYTRRLITRGTLLAVFLATSDEAVPVILAQPERGKIVIGLLLVKLIIGIVGGYAVDIFFKKPAHDGLPVDEEIHERGCCKHDITQPTGKWQWLTHPLIHTAKVFLFIFAVTFGINYLVSMVGEANLGNTLLRQSVLQPFLAALIGLIPNCSASVAITQAYLKGGLSYGSVIAGLCSAGGIGILILLKENHDFRDTMKILFLLTAISTIVGTAIHLLFG